MLGTPHSSEQILNTSFVHSSIPLFIQQIYAEHGDLCQVLGHPGQSRKLHGWSLMQPFMWELQQLPPQSWGIMARVMSIKTSGEEPRVSGSVVV